jgi:hypothetical protein
VDGEEVMTTYHVTVTREDGMWVADVLNLTAATEADHFADLDVEVRDLISGLTDADPDGLDIDWTYVFGADDVTGLVRELRHADDALAFAEAQRDQARKLLIKVSKQAGLSERAVADVLGLSHQRVNQLSNAS